MAALQRRPTQRMLSRCTPATARATLAFEINGYSLHKGMGIGNFIRSTPVSVAGYEWCIRYYPDGPTEQFKDYVSVYVELLSKCAYVRALYDFRLIDQTSGLSSSVMSSSSGPPSVLFNNSLDIGRDTSAFGWNQFKLRSELEEPAFLQDDRLIIECDLTVIKQPLVYDTRIFFEDQMPPSDLSHNLGKWLETAEEADVTFIVKGERFPAHRMVLAIRSPVFKAELYGPMRDKSRHDITVQDMQPAVFKALLHFIYTDSLPSMEDLDDAENNKEMVKHLLVAADRYALERLKLVCEGILCKSLDVESVATMLALADQHQCSRLKDACVEFFTSSNTMDDVVASQGYVHLKRSCPALLVDIFERATKSRKI